MMTDQTVEALRRIKAHAYEHGADIERVEVNLSEHGGETRVEFTAFYVPKPLPQSTACLAYVVDPSAT